MPRIFLISMVLALLLSSKQSAPPDLFDHQVVHLIELNAADDSLMNKLDHSYRYTNKKYFKVALKIDGQSVGLVGIRQKGKFSNSFAWTDKKPLKLKLNEYEKTKYQGHKKLNLSNAFEDPSFLREPLSAYCLQEMGQATPKTSHAAVYYNGNYMGLYVLREQIDKAFLKRNFDENEGNLFKIESGCLDAFDDKGLSEKFYELKTNKKENNRQGLKQFIRFIERSTDQNFEDSINVFINVKSYLRTAAFNFIAGNRDSYVWGRCHNYYLYAAANGQFETIPFDYNLSFGYNLDTEKQAELPNANSENLNKLMLRLFQVTSHYQMFIQYCQQALFLIKAKSTMKWAKKQHKIIQPWIEKDSNLFYPYQRFEQSLKGPMFKGGQNAQIPGIKEFVKIQLDRYLLMLKTEAHLKD